MATHALREIQYADEAGTFAANAASPASNTWAKRIPVQSVDSGPPEQDRQTDGSIQSRQNDSRPGFLGPRSASLEFTTLFPGHSTATTGSLAATWALTLLGDGLGGSSVAQVGGAILTGTNVTTFTTGGTAVAGAIGRIGTKGDTRCDGQATVISNASTITTLVALPGTASTADFFYATQMAYPSESVVNSKRFLVGFAETGAQYHYMGCHLSGLTCNFPIGGLPTLRWKYDCAYWAKSAVTIPSALALESADAAPICGGSLFLQTEGTTTRAVVSPAEVSLTLDIGLAAKTGPAAGQATYQTINGFERTQCVPTVSLLLPWSTTYDTLHSVDGSSTVYKHLLFTANTTDGRSVGFYLPRAYLVGGPPMYEDYNGLLYQRLTFRGREGAITTNDLTKSAVRFYMG